MVVPLPFLVVALAAQAVRRFHTTRCHIFLVNAYFSLAAQAVRRFHTTTTFPDAAAS